MMSKIALVTIRIVSARSTIPNPRLRRAGAGASKTIRKRKCMLPGQAQVLVNQARDS